MTYTSRVLFYYLQQIFPSCCCEYPIAGYRADIFLVDEKIVIEHFGYTHQKESSKARDEKRLQVFEQRGLRVIRLVEVKDAVKGFHQDGDIIYYHDKQPYPRLDSLICYLIRYLEAVLEESLFYNKPNHKQDFAAIDHLYYLERKKRTLAIQFSQIAQEWSPNNPCRTDVVPAKSGHKYKWICPECGEEYEATVYNRTHNRTGHSTCRHFSRKERLDTLSN